MSDANLPLLPFILATLLLVTAMVGARVRRRWPLWVQLATGLVVFALLTILVQRLLGSPLLPRYSAIASGKDVWEHAIEAGWWVMAAGIGVTVIRLLVVLEHRPRETQIVSDLMAGAIYLATLLAIVNFVFAVPVAGLLATSGVIAIVLGLALQNTLADVFSGIAVGIERPYKAGDLIWVEGNIEGHVVLVTWRSTHIATFQSTIAIVPNSVMAKARLINRSRPDPTRGDTVEIRLDAMALPERCSATLTAARAGRDDAACLSRAFGSLQRLAWGRRRLRDRLLRRHQCRARSGADRGARADPPPPAPCGDRAGGGRNGEPQPAPCPHADRHAGRV